MDKRAERKHKKELKRKLEKRKFLKIHLGAKKEPFYQPKKPHPLQRKAKSTIISIYKSMAEKQKKAKKKKKDKKDGKK